MPTVGVHDDDASGKKSAGMQKHFRHLVNETASKQRFLRSLHRSSSAKEGSGSLPPGMKGEPSIKHEELGVRQEAGIKQEPGIKQESGSFGLDELTSAPAGAERVHDGSDTDIAASAGLPDSLGEELGDAACLKADPDSLMHDAFIRADSLCLKAAASETQTGTAKQTMSKASQAPANDHQHVVNEFLSILGGGVNADTAKSFVIKANGNLAAAINSFYDSAAVKTEESDQQANSSETALASSSETSAKSVGQGTHPSTADPGAISAAQKRAGQPEPSKQKSKGRKRAAASQDGIGDASGKKTKQSDSAQRSIATFFGGRQLTQAKTPQVVKQEDVHQQHGCDPNSQGCSLSMQANSPQQSITAKEEATGMRERSVDMALHQAKHEDTIDLVDDMGHIKDEPMNDDTVTFNGDHSLPVPSAKSETVLADGVLAIGAEQGARRVDNFTHISQPVHPFFGKRQASKPAMQADIPSSNHTAQVASNLREQPSSLDEKPKRINPFQKPQTEPERDVPADAVLLPTSDYDPVGMAVWEAGQATPYRHISRAFQAMESTTKRLRIGDAIANMFRSILALSPGESPTGHAFISLAVG